MAGFLFTPFLLRANVGPGLGAILPLHPAGTSFLPNMCLK